MAAKDLAAGEEFLVETAAIVGPKHHTPLLCLGCMARTTGDTLCTRCGWPVCGPECEDLPLHKCAPIIMRTIIYLILNLILALYRNSECTVFAAANVKFGAAPEDSTDDCPQLECIAPLRLLLTLGTERWKNEVKLINLAFTFKYLSK